MYAYLPKRQSSANDLVYSAVGEGKQIKEYIYAAKMYQFAPRNPQLIQRNLICRWLVNRLGPVVSKQRMDQPRDYLQL